jgi:hypothetical protein
LSGKYFARIFNKISKGDFLEPGIIGKFLEFVIISVIFL